MSLFTKDHQPKTLRDKTEEVLSSVKDVPPKAMDELRDELEKRLKEPKPEAEKPETVDHPPHYGGEDDPYEAIKVIEAWDLDFNTGNAVKYIRRAPHKGSPLEDYRKAAWYLARKIENMERAIEKAEQALREKKIKSLEEQLAKTISSAHDAAGARPGGNGPEGGQDDRVD